MIAHSKMTSGLLAGIAAVLITAVSIDASARTETSAASRPEWNEARKTTVDQYLSRLAGLGFNGGIAILIGDETVFRKAYGTADRAAGKPLTTDAVMTVGSLTKQFTGAAIALLEARGKISLDDPLSKHMKGVPADKSGVLIRHLLTHAAGFPGAVGHDHDITGTRERVKREALRRPLEFPPGEERSYSNTGYSLLAMVIENITGMSYETFITTSLLAPAGMTDTGYTMPGWDRSRMPVGYRDGKPQKTFVDVTMLDDGPTWHLRGNGGILSTVEDMERWIRALRDGSVLGEETTRRFLQPVFSGSSRDYGYGFGHGRTRRGTRLVDHDGGNMVFNADLHLYVDEDVSIFMNTSVGEIPAEMIIDQIESIVFGHPYAMPPATRPVPAAELDALTGTYTTEDGVGFEILRDGDRLEIRPQDDIATDLVLGGSGKPDSTTLAAIRRAGTIARAIFGGDDKALMAAFPGHAVEQLHEWFRPDLEHARSMGGARTVAARGVSAGPDGGHRVTMRIDFVRGSDALTFGLDRSGGVRGIMSAPVAEGRLLLYPIGNGEFERYSLASNTTTKLRIADGEVRFISGGIRARRSSAQGD